MGKPNLQVYQMERSQAGFLEEAQTGYGCLGRIFHGEGRGRVPEGEEESWRQGWRVPEGVCPHGRIYRLSTKFLCSFLSRKKAVIGFPIFASRNHGHILN